MLALVARPGGAVVDAGLGPRAVPGELLVRFEPGATATARAEARRRAGVRLERRLLLPGLELVRPGTGMSVGAAIDALGRQPGVRYAEPNSIATPQATPNDARFGEQWALMNIGQSGGTPGADISAVEAWEATTGDADVVVAVIDGGVAYDHPDLAGNMWTNTGESGDKALNRIDDDGNHLVDDRLGWDFYNSDADPYDSDVHGTLVAGAIGAEGANGRGVAGVSHEVSLMPLQVCEGRDCSTSAIVDAITYAGRMGADVANISIGGSFSQAEKDAIDSASGTLFVAGAGNNPVDRDVLPTYPCSYDSANLICVAATDRSDGLWGSSSFGPTTVDLGAPGVDVLSTATGRKTVFSDGFEGATANWDYDEVGDPVHAERWRRIQEGVNGTSVFVLTDSQSGDYPNGANTTVALQAPVDLSGEAGCSLRYRLNLKTEVGHDYVVAEAASTQGGPWIELERHSGDTAGWSTQRTAALDQFDGGRVSLRFRLTSDGSGTLDGAYLDDATVACDDPANSYTAATGTSLAAPHVAGAAALLKAAYPGASVAELRARILGSIDPLPSLAGKTVTGGRLNVYAALTETPDTTAPDPTVDETETGGGGQEEAPPSETTYTSPSPAPLAPQPAPSGCSPFASWPFDPCARLAFGTKALRRRDTLAVRARCVGPKSCTGSLRALAGRRVGARGRYRVRAGERRSVRLPLTIAGRTLLPRRGARRRVRLTLQLRPTRHYRWRDVGHLTVRARRS